MTFEESYDQLIPNERAILAMVDEYSLYCYYTDIADLMPGKAYSAPYYRKDDEPSFAIFESRSPLFTYMWKDHATGESGTIFMLIAKIEQLKGREEVFARINTDFELGYDSLAPIRTDKIILFDAPEVSPAKIRITEIPFSKKGVEFWSQFRIGQALLNEYLTTQASFYWTYPEQEIPIQAPDPTFSYRIGAYYQLYSPFAPRRFKFRNDLPENYFFGYLQLPPTGKVLIIDKSCKDVIFCRRLGFNAVCGKSETTWILEKKMLELHERFPEIFLMLDNDEPGKRQVEKYMKKYPWLKPRFLPKWKDKTDNCKMEGFEQTKQLTEHLVYEQG